MASVSMSMSRNGGAIFVLATGSETVTLGTSAPGVGSLELRVDNAVGWRKAELLIALERFKDYIENNLDVPV